MDAPLPLGADNNLPYVFDAFPTRDVYEDALTPVLLDKPEARAGGTPLNQSLVTFPAPRGN